MTTDTPLDSLGRFAMGVATKAMPRAVWSIFTAVELPDGRPSLVGATMYASAAGVLPFVMELSPEGRVELSLPAFGEET